MVKCRQTECLSLGVCPQICFKSKRVNSRNEGFDEEEGEARYRGEGKKEIKWLTV